MKPLHTLARLITYKQIINKMKKLIFIAILTLSTLFCVNAQTLNLTENDEAFEFCSLSDIDTALFQPAPICMCSADLASFNALKNFVGQKASGMSFVMALYTFTWSMTFNGGTITANYTFNFHKNPYISNPVTSMNNICMVAFNNDSNVFEVVIDNTNTLVDSFRVEKKIFNTWTHLATIGSDSSHILDMSTNFTSAESYRVFSIDTCGFTRPLSLMPDSSTTYHSTVFLQYSSGNLIWSSYQVNEQDASISDGFSGYYLYRGSSPQTLSIYDSVSININQYTDLSPDTSQNFYQIEAIKNSCDPFRSTLSTRSNKLQVANFANIQNMEPSTIHKVWVYEGILRFEGNQAMNVELYTIEGKQLYVANNIVSLTLPVEQNIIVCVVSDMQGRKAYKFINVK